MHENKLNHNNENDRRIRRRFRGMMESKTGKTVKYTSLAASIVAFIINDLRKPNSMTRQLIGKTVNKLLELKNKKIEAIDITDKVEILGESNHNKLINSE